MLFGSNADVILKFSNPPCLTSVRSGEPHLWGCVSEKFNLYRIQIGEQLNGCSFFRSCISLEYYIFVCYNIKSVGGGSNKELLMVTHLKQLENIMEIMKRKKSALLVAAVVVFAVICRVLGKCDFHSTVCGIIRSMLYIGLYIGWGISNNRRIIQKTIRIHLIVVSNLMVFWFIVRSIKYMFVAGPTATRYLWYSYYIPLLLIPLIFLIVSIMIGKAENSSLPKSARLLYIPTLLCIFMVLTNDLHQFVFSFPEGEVCLDTNNGYEWGYYIILLWEIICAVAAFVLMVVKSRKSNRKKYLPILLILCSIIYALIYVSGVEWMQILGGDVTAVQCLMYMLILESCVQCGLIQTNTGYKELFQIGTIGAQITDIEHNVQYASANTEKMSRDVILKAEGGGTVIGKNILVKSSPIRGGHVLWQEDVSDIIELLSKLEENRKSIEDSNRLKQENYKVKVQINALKEKNRLYDNLKKQMEGQIELMESMIAQYETEKNSEAAKKLLAKIGVMGTYIKRRSNLIFVDEKDSETDISELSACMKESFINLKFMGVECALDIPDIHDVNVQEMTHIYDFFEEVIEVAIDNIQSIWIKGRLLKDKVLICMEIETEKDLSAFSQKADCTNCEDGVWHFELSIKRRVKHNE